MVLLRRGRRERISYSAHGPQPAHQLQGRRTHRTPTATPAAVQVSVPLPPGKGVPVSSSQLCSPQAVVSPTVALGVVLHLPLILVRLKRGRKIVGGAETPGDLQSLNYPKWTALRLLRVLDSPGEKSLTPGCFSLCQSSGVP